MASWGLKMVMASLKKTQSQDQQDLTASSTSGSVGQSHFNVFDVDPENPFDVKTETKGNTGRKQDQMMEDSEEKTISFSDQSDGDDDYVPNSESESSSGDESIISACVPMLAAFAPSAIESSVMSVNSASEERIGSITSNINCTTKNVDCATTANVEHTSGVSSSDVTIVQEQRVKRPCVYCGTFQSQLLRHLKRKHAQEEAVSAAIGLPKQDQQKAFDKIRKLGIFEKNISLQKEGATLIRERRQGKEDGLAVCNGCKGFFNTKQIWRHKKICSALKGYSVGSVNFSDYVVSAKDLGITEDFKKDILYCFRHDEAGGICRTDKMVLMIGQRLWAKSAKKEKHVIMSDMRLLANIIVEMRRIKQDDALDGKAVLYRENFETLRDAIQCMSTSEGGSLKAGMKLKIGYLLKKLIKVSKGYYIQTNELDMAEETDRFASLLDLNWDFIFYTAQLHCEQRRSSLRKPQELPAEEDLVKLRDFIVHEMTKLVEATYNKWDIHDFILMRNLIVSRLTIFNARRGGEPARLTVKEWNDAENDVWIDPQFVQKIDDPLEKSMLNQYKLAYQAGKGSRKLVPILIPNDTVLPLQKLVEVREEFEIPESNPFLFPNTGGSSNHVIGWHSINKIVYMIRDKLQKPSLLIADKFRHRVSTLFALLELPADDRSKFYRHMGHSEEISKNVYQSPLALGEIIKVGGFLQSVDKPASSTNLSPRTAAKEVQLNDSASNRINVLQDTDTVTIDDEEMGIEQPQQVSVSSSTVSPESSATKSSLTKRRERRYQKWSENDTNLVRNYFSGFIMNAGHTGVKGSLPGKKMVEEFLKQHNIFQGANLSHDIIISLVKTKIFNERKKERSSQSFKVL